MTDCAALTTNHGTPCMHRGVYHRDGQLYCWQHDPERMQRTREARETRLQADLDKIRDRLARKEACYRFFEDSDIPTERIPVGGFVELVTLVEFVGWQKCACRDGTCPSCLAADLLAKLGAKLGVDP